jgi:hypothetical protein
MDRAASAQEQGRNMPILSRKREESMIGDAFNSPKRSRRVTVRDVRRRRVTLDSEVNADVPARRFLALGRIRGVSDSTLESAVLRCPMRNGPSSTAT